MAHELIVEEGFLKRTIDTNITGEVVIPEGVTRIADKAFSRCSNITSIVIPDSVTDIGESAFAFCYSLESITIPNGITHISDWMFHKCTSLKKVEISDRVTSIGKEAFKGCGSLTTIIIPEGVTSIGERAFDSCHNLTSISIPSTVEHIGEGALTDCMKLEQIVLPDHPKFGEGDWFKSYWGVLEESKVPTNLLSELNELEPFMDKGAFERMINKTSVWSNLSYERQANAYLYRKNAKLSKSFKKFIKPKDCEPIAKEMLLKLQGKKTAKENNSIRDFLIDYHAHVSDDTFISLYEKLNKTNQTAILETVKNGTDHRIKALLSVDNAISQSENNVVIKDTGTAEKSDDAADFHITKKGILKEYTGNKTEIIFPPEVIIVGEDVFSDPYRGRIRNAGYYLEKVVFPGTVKEIKPRGFRGCKQLRQVEFHEGLEKIGESAFWGCDNLEEIYIPSSVRVVGKASFWHHNIRKVELFDTVEEIGRDSFEDLVPTKDLEIRINCIAHNVSNQKQIVLALKLDNVAYSFLHDKLTASDYIMEMIYNRLKVKSNRMSMIRKAIELDDLQVIKKLLSLDIKIPKKEVEEVIENVSKQNKTELVAWLLEFTNSHF